MEASEVNNNSDLRKLILSKCVQEEILKNQWLLIHKYDVEKLADAFEEILMEKNNELYALASENAQLKIKINQPNKTE